MVITERRWAGKDSAPAQWQGMGVVAAASHPGGANSILPIVDRLQGLGAPVTLFTAGKINEPKSVVTSFHFSAPPEIREVPSVALPDPLERLLVLAGASSLPDLELELALMAAATQRTSDRSATQLVLVEDMPGTLRGVIQQMEQRGIGSDRIDRMFLTTGSAARNYPTDEYGVPRERMVITGSATFDAIKTEDTRAVNNEVRRQLQIPWNTLAIAYFGMPSQEPHFEGMEFRSTATISQAMAKLAHAYAWTNFAFLHRRHPREADPDRLAGLLPKSITNLRVIPHEESAGIPTRNVGAAANLGISLGSTVNTEMALRGARDNSQLYPPREQTGSMPVYLLNPDAIGIFGHPDYRYEIPIPVQLGAAAVAWNNDQLLSVIEKVLYDGPARARIANQQATLLRAEYAFGRPGTAGDTAVSELENLL